MKSKIGYLVIAVIGNALGTALMKETYLGMTAWGSSSLNTSNFLGVSIGSAFVILSVLFYVIALVLLRQFSVKNMLYSFLFLFSFAYVTDLFVWIIPSFESTILVLRVIINIIGLLVLLFSIALHLQLNLAVHPMDVFLQAVQLKTKSITVGTYIAYTIAFTLGITLGYLYGDIQGLGIGTAFTLLFSGIVMNFYDKKILHHVIKK